MLAEHTKPRGRVDVGGWGRRLSWAARGLVSPIASLKIYIQDLASNADSLLSSPHTAAGLGFGEELPLIPPISVHTHGTFVHGWADRPL